MPAFSISNVNLLALPVPGIASYVWDDLQFTLDHSQRVGIGAGPVSLGATATVNANAGLRVTLNTDFGTASIGYSLAAPVFINTTDPNSVPVPPTDGLPYYLNADAVLDSASMIRTGSSFSAVAPNIQNNSLDVDFFYDVSLSLSNIGVEIDLWLDSWNLDIIPGTYQIMQAAGTVNLIHLAPDDSSWTAGSGALTGVIHLPGPSQFGAQQVGSGVRPSIALEGDDANNFAELTFDITQKLAEITGISSSYVFNPIGGVTIQATLLQVLAVAGLRTSQYLSFTPEVVKVDLFVPVTGQHIAGVLGDRFELATPNSGEGVANVEATYTLYGTYTSEAGVKLNGRIDLNALALHLSNTNFYDFDLGFGPLLKFSIPDSTGWQTDRLALYDKSLALEFAPVTETLQFRYERFAYASDTPDEVTLTSNQPTVLGQNGAPDGHLFGGDDTLYGNTLANDVHGDAGADEMWGGAGNDTLHGDDGNDYIVGDEGQTVQFNDYDPGTPGTHDDLLFGGAGNDTIIGEQGNDTIDAGTGGDMLRGGVGDDYLISLATDLADIITGGPGFDTALVSRSGSTLTFTADFRAAAETENFNALVLADGSKIWGVETVFFAAGFGDDSLRGGDGNDTLTGGWGNDTLRGGLGEDSLGGGAGNDLFMATVNDADDAMDGGSGIDTLDVTLDEDAGASIDLLHTAVNHLPNGSSFRNIERIVFVSFSATAEDSINGGLYDDTIFGGGGNDLLDGSLGHDALNGDDGDDVIFSHDKDYIAGGNGIDTVVLDRSGGDLPVGISVDFSRVNVDGLRRLSDGTILLGVERLFFVGTGRADIVTGGALRDELYGEGGDDLLKGGLGADVVGGGAGNDTVMQSWLDGDGSHPGIIDLLDGGDDFDTLMLDASGFGSGITIDLSVFGGQSQGVLPDLTDIRNFERINLRGTAQGDSIIGGNHAVDIVTRSYIPATQFSPPTFLDTVTGQLANVMRSGAGNDTLKGGTQRDEIFGGSGDDRITLTTGGDLLDAGEDTPSGPPDANGVRTRLPAADTDRDVLVIDGYAPNGLDFTHLLDQDPNDQALRGMTMADGTRLLNFEAVEFSGSFSGGMATGSPGADVMMAGGGSNLLDGGAGNDSIRGAFGADTLRGGLGDDTINSGGGNDSLAGGDGDDTVTHFGYAFPGMPPGASYAQLFGNAGDDILSSNVASAIDGGDGTDRLILDARYNFGQVMVQDFRAMAGTLTLADGMVLKSIENLWFAGANGDDQIALGAGVHQVNGGGGQDRLLLDLSQMAGLQTAGYIAVDDGFGFFSLVLQFGNGTQVWNIEEIAIIAGPGGLLLNNMLPANFDTAPSISVDYNSAPFYEVGTPQDDTMQGGSANDVLHGERGADTMDGGAGNDGMGGGLGDDSLRGGLGDDLLWGGAGNDALDGGDGEDQAFYGFSQGAITVSLMDGRASGDGEDTLSGMENVRTGSGDDSVTGDDGANVIVAGAGNDTVQGGGGDDVLWAEGGADSLFGGDGRDIIYAGIDDDVVDAGAGHDAVAGGAGNDFIDGNSGDDALWGEAGEDTIDGGEGHDNLYGGEGNDLLRGRDGNDALAGADGNDTLDGGAGLDALFGGGGNDVLIGGPGGDWLIGGSGQDLFVHEAAELGVDWIGDFNRAEGDLIDVSALRGGTPFVIGAAPAAYRLVLEFNLAEEKTFVRGYTDADALVDFSFGVTHAGLAMLDAQDFIL